MARTRAITAGEAWIRFGADRTQFQRQLKMMERDFRRWGRNLSRIGSGMAIFGGAGLFGLGGMLKVAAEAETAWRRFFLIFDSSAKVMIKRLREIRAATGVGLNTLAKQAATFGAIFSEVKTTLGEAQFVQIVGEAVENVQNLAALAGVGFDEAMSRMTSAFTSTGEAVDQYGINIREAEMRMEAQRLGVNKAVRDMTELEKQLIKMSLINKSFTETGVSFVRMSNTLNVQFALMIQNIEHLVEAGMWALRMVLVPMMQVFNKLLQIMRPLAYILGPFVALGAAGLASIATLGVVLAAIGFVIAGIGQLVGAIAVLSKGAGFAVLLKVAFQLGRAFAFVARVVTRIIAAIKAIPAVLAAIFAFIGSLNPVMAALIGAAGILSLIHAGVNRFLGQQDMGTNRTGDVGTAGWLRTIQDWVLPRRPNVPRGPEYAPYAAFTPPGARNLVPIGGSVSAFGGDIARQAGYLSATGGGDAASNTGALAKMFEGVLSEDKAALNVNLWNN